LLIKPSQLFSAFKEMRPTLCLAPPLLYETIHSRFDSAIRDLSLPRRLVFRTLSSLAEYVPVGAIRDRLLSVCYGKVHETLGGRVRILWTGMAPIKRSTLEFFARARVPLFEAYGLTECGAITSNSPGNNKIGSVGKPVTEGGVFLAEDGEIIVRQEHVQTIGYLECDADDQRSTYLDSHTLATGDIGRFDEEGYLYLIGRKKEIIITGQGYKVHPEGLESRINHCPQVARSVVFGTGLPYLVALVSVDGEATEAVGEKVRRWLEQVNAELPPASRIVRFFITAEQFTRDNGFMTRSLKLDRRAIYSHFERDILSGKVLTDDVPVVRATTVEERVDRAADLARQAEIEQVIVREWKEVLNVQAIGRNDNFFDLGGNSLGVVTLSRRLREIFKLDMPNTIMFQYPTIGALADYVGRAEVVQAESAKENVPASARMKYGAGRASSDIAIISMGARLPKAGSVREFWHNLREGVEAISFFTDEELKAAGVSPELLSLPSYIKAGSIINDIESFDAAFFGMNPREAQLMDPQQRLFLETVWEAMESAGYDPERFKGKIGVFAGAGINTYLLFNLLSNPDIIQSAGDHMILVGNDKDFLATRISYILNLKGPSITVQTACSTSLVAVHMACESLLTGHCDMAVAGAVTVRASQKKGYLTEESGLLSPDGHCRAFDAKAMGTVFGNGLGVVVLKRLEDAVADGDHIHAVVKGTAINNDGSLKIGYLAPSVEGQAEVIALAHAAAGIDPSTISYVEAHGTGTMLGDPVEMTAITKAFRERTDKKNFCAIGSVKTNIGHLDTAAGIAGLIKTALALEHKQIPPSLNFEEPNPNIDFESSPFYVSTTLREWAAGDTPRRAGVSSFGFGGTNSHIVLEEAPATEPSGEAAPWQLLVLSAKTETSLEAATHNLANFLSQNSDVNLADVAYTLKVGRKPFSYRRAVVCLDAADAISALGSQEAGRVHTRMVDEFVNPPVAFMFAGYGSQQVNMGEELYRVESVFREEVDRCSELLKPHLGFDIRDVLYPGEERIEEAAERINLIWIAQPALFVIEYATAKLWMHWGVHPRMLIGYSTGEYVAAHFAGVFSLEDVLAIIVERSLLMHDLESGSMLAIPLPENELVALLDPRLSIAAVNGPVQCVASGPTELIDELEASLIAKEVSCRRLDTSHAYHSTMMEPMIEPFKERMNAIKLHPPRIPFASNLTGTWITPEEAVSVDYWARHLRHTVRFADGVKTLLESPNAILLDVGPGQTLSSFAKQQVSRDGRQGVVSSSGHRREQSSDEAAILSAAGDLWIRGVEMNWERFYSRQRRHRVALPTYPFERQRYWIEAKSRESLAQENGPSMYQVAGKNPNIEDWFYVPLWKQSILRDRHHADAGPDLEPAWLVFMCEHDLGNSLADRLRRDGARVITVVTADEYGKLDETLYGINPQRLGDYLALLHDLASAANMPNKILHLWSVGAAHDARPVSESFEVLQERGYYSLLFLARALAEQNMTDPLQLFVVADGLFEVERGD
ncbi:MAG TPA: beta-ketoacyl synthase N-terminal-like domain-containing protein, partial [Blastocatellia bacterium]